LVNFYRLADGSFWPKADMRRLMLGEHDRWSGSAVAIQLTYNS